MCLGVEGLGFLRFTCACLDPKATYTGGGLRGDWVGRLTRVYRVCGRVLISSMEWPNYTVQMLNNSATLPNP